MICAHGALAHFDLGYNGDGIVRMSLMREFLSMRQLLLSADNMQSLVAVAGTGTPPAGPGYVAPDLAR